MIKIKIKDKEMTVDEAREMYHELKALFGENENVNPPLVPYRNPHDYQPWPPYRPSPDFTYTTCKTAETSNA